jgi:transcriptional regulator with XRE-family HTH domain
MRTALEPQHSSTPAPSQLTDEEKEMGKQASPPYQTITGRRLPVGGLSKVEKQLLQRVQQRFNARLEWTRFAAWWNAEFTKSGLSPKSPVYHICQDLEARLGIDQGSVSPPDYRDFLADLIDGRFGSRHEFCQATGVDPGQLSRVFAGRADLSLRALHKVLEVLDARLIIQTQEQAREQTSVARAEEALALATR